MLCATYAASYKEMGWFVGKAGPRDVKHDVTLLAARRVDMKASVPCISPLSLVYGINLDKRSFNSIMQLLPPV